MNRLLLATVALGVCLACLGYPAGGARQASGPTANVFVGRGGNDGGCRRVAPAQPAPATPCASVSRALALAQPGDVVQLLPGDYGSMSISRQSGADSPRVIVRGDPAMPAQRSCWQGCAR